MSRKDVPGTIYLLCFEKPLAHARHYLGWTEDADPSKRLDTHRSGDGSPLVRAVVRSGIDFRLVRTWDGKTRHDERRLKKRKDVAVLCPVCRSAALARKAQAATRRRMERKAETAVKVEAVRFEQERWDASLSLPF